MRGQRGQSGSEWWPMCPKSDRSGRHTPPRHSTTTGGSTSVSRCISTVPGFSGVTGAERAALKGIVSVIQSYERPLYLRLNSNRSRRPSFSSLHSTSESTALADRLCVFYSQLFSFSIFLCTGTIPMNGTIIIIRYEFYLHNRLSLRFIKKPLQNTLVFKEVSQKRLLFPTDRVPSALPSPAAAHW